MLTSYFLFHTNSYTIIKVNFLDLLHPQLKVPSERCTRMNELSQTHLNWQAAAKRKHQNLEGNGVELAILPQYSNSFCAHVPMWRLSRLQNLAISPLATILLFEKQPRSEQDWGVTEHHGESHRLSQLRKLQKSLIHCFDAVCTPGQSVLRGWQLAHCSEPLGLAAPDVPGMSERKF